MIDIEKLSEKDLKQKIENIKAEREKTANALKIYENELERRKRAVPLGVPIGGAISRSFLLRFPSKESADKFDNEYFNNFVKALCNIAEGKPIDIKALAPLLPKGKVCCSESGTWFWTKGNVNIADIFSKICWNFDEGYCTLYGFNIEPAKDWENSLMECGL